MSIKQIIKYRFIQLKSKWNQLALLTLWLILEFWTKKSQVELKIYITHLTLKKTLKKINGTLNFFFVAGGDVWIIS